MLGLLRRLLGGGPEDHTESTHAEATEPEAAERIEAARQRLKETIPPPEDDTP